VGLSQIGAGKVGLDQVGAGKVELGQIGAGKVGLDQVGAGKVGLGQELATLRCLVRESNMVFVGSIEELFAPLRESSPPPPSLGPMLTFCCRIRKFNGSSTSLLFPWLPQGSLSVKRTNQGFFSAVVKCRNELLS
jgi:hypothetical protein